MLNPLYYFFSTCRRLREYAEPQPVWCASFAGVWIWDGDLACIIYSPHLKRKVTFVPAASTNYLPWFLCPLNSWNKDIYPDLCASASSSVVEGALGTEGGTLSLDVLHNGYEQPVCGTEASQWIALCSHNGSRKGINWVFFLPFKQFFDSYSFPLKFPDNFFFFVSQKVFIRGKNSIEIIFYLFIGKLLLN